MTELWALAGCELARLVSERAVSAREVVQAHLDRIAQVNPALNAVTAVLDGPALQAADAADAALLRGEEPGPLCGVPMTVKENIDVAGSATTLGIAALRDAVARRDAPHVGELRAAGAIPLGRAAMPEFGMRWHTTSALRGATRNPWSARHTPGGSSGGDAAAVASGMVPLGMGNDGAGSLRWPAACCGVTALKPSLGRVPQGGGHEPPQPAPFAFQLLAVVEAVAPGEFARFWEVFGPAWTAAAGSPAFDPMMERAAIARAWHTWMAQTPLVLAPVCARQPFTIGDDLDPGWLAGWPAALRICVAVNLLGLPAVTVPAGCEGGLPQGVQVIGPRFREDLCLDAAEAIEERTAPLTPISPRARPKA
jgi:Asp-tRNA(Asn)/Glu-tRNA(Gln) amidotransferase A subunit family amidase